MTKIQYLNLNVILSLIKTFYILYFINITLINKSKSSTLNWLLTLCCEYS